MLRRFLWMITVALPLVSILGCGSSEVEYPENPTPPPTSDPGVSSTPPTDQDG